MLQSFLESHITGQIKKQTSCIYVIRTEMMYIQQYYTAKISGKMKKIKGKEKQDQTDN